MKTVLAHDSFTQNGGAERLFSALLESFPDSPVYTLKTSPGYNKILTGKKVHTSFLQNWPFSKLPLKFLMPLIPLAIAWMRVEKSDVLLSSSSAFIKALKKPAHSLHINYCHTPTRFLWTDHNYFKEELPVVLWPFVKVFFSWLKIWDKKAAKKIDVFIANSEEVKKRIKTYYGQDALICYPFVDLNFWKPTQEKGNYFLLAGRLQAYKRGDIVIKAFSTLNIPLLVVGEGRDLKRLKQLAQAANNISFLSAGDEKLRDIYSGALALIFPQEEDFGMMPLEAMACATPVIAYGKAGALETVVSGTTGEFFSEQTPESLAEVVKNFKPENYLKENLIARASEFSKEKFINRIQQIVQSSAEIKY